jgi:hypothetical protein
LLDPRYRVHTDTRRLSKARGVFTILWEESKSGAATTRPALREKVWNIIRFILLSFFWTGALQPHREWCNDAIFVDGQVDLRRLSEAIYRIVWFELPRLFGLYVLSVLPVCTNMLGFVVCWLTILRSINTWKCTGRSLPLM